MSDETKKRFSTSIKIDPKLWKEFKKTAIDQDTTVTELLEKIISDFVSNIKK
jgi:predicted DNA-binding ribbon-helix-helix protein